MLLGLAFRQGSSQEIAWNGTCSDLADECSITLQFSSCFLDLSKAQNAWAQPSYVCPELCDQLEIAVVVGGLSAAGHSAAGLRTCSRLLRLMPCPATPSVPHLPSPSL